MIRTLKQQRLLLFFLPLILAAPFLRRAYFVDDNYFVEIAHWLKDHPTRPYDFRADDAGPQNLGWEKDGFVRMVNPLAHHYYLALLMKLGGEQEWFLRLGCVLLSCFSALFIFEFARRWTDHPFFATVLTVLTPAFWLTSYSLLIDGTMAFFFFGGLYFFIRGFERSSMTRLVVSGIMMGLAILSKYPAVLIVPLTAAWLALGWKKFSNPWRALIPWTIAALFLLAYSAYTAKLYGAPHILAASKRMVQVYGWSKYVVFFVFLPGVTFLPLLAWLRSGKTSLLALLGLVMLYSVFHSHIGGFNSSQSILLALWIVTSGLWVVSYLVQFRTWTFPRDHFLFAWVGGFILMMFVVMGWVAARYYLIAVPAIVFSSVRLVEWKFGERSVRVLMLFAGALFICGAILAYVDYEQAEPSRLIGSQLQQQGIGGGPRHFYLGDSFTMSYLKNYGWVPCFPQTELRPGDLVLSKEVTMPLKWFANKKLTLRILTEFNYPSHIPVKVMDYRGSAGFYASVWGALPFTFSTGPAERFRVFEVEQAASF